MSAGHRKIDFGDGLVVDDQGEARAAVVLVQVLGADHAAAVTHGDDAGFGTTLEVVVKIAAGRHEQRAVLRQATGKRTFFLGDRIAAAHILDVSGADVRNDPEIGPRDLAQRGNLAGMVHAHLEHRGSVVFLQRQHAQRHPDVVVEVPVSTTNVVGAAENGDGEILGAGLAIRTGDADDGDFPLATIPGGEALEGGEAVRHADDGGILRRLTFPTLDHHDGGTGGDGLAGEVVRVETFAAQGKENRTLRDGAGVGGNRVRKHVGPSGGDLATGNPGQGACVDGSHRLRGGSSGRSARARRASRRSSKSMVRSANCW